MKYSPSGGLVGDVQERRGGGEERRAEVSRSRTAKRASLLKWSVRRVDEEERRGEGGKRESKERVREM